MTPIHVANKYQLREIEDVVPADGNTVAYDYLYVGNTVNTSGTVPAGNVKLTLADGSSATFYNCPNGKEIIASIVTVWSSGTTATNMVGAKIE
jgi:hypothetical protein